MKEAKKREEEEKANFNVSYILRLRYSIIIFEDLHIIIYLYIFF